MGRPRKYFTNEEKRIANCIKSKRHYDRNKDAILSERQHKAGCAATGSDRSSATAEEQSSESGQQKAATEAHDSEEGCFPETRSAPLVDKFKTPEYWVTRAKKSACLLSGLCSGRKQLDCLDHICLSYLKKAHNDPKGALLDIENHMEGVANLVRRLTKIHSFVSKLNGTEADLKRASRLLEAVLCHLEDLEEIISYVIVSYKEVYFQFMNKRFSFQI
ncbi:hypothetical protein FA15DRAFT_675370 [Coprinopsis marcescibilis]|uniref:Uncharacterized protein n=1 Tax=Coprinopsis marcescibilis TaxID=230819 RepID=A0A5C3KF20_COPMA|nr:hypothetical protein FA15DRAFT_675370 [Coprinopsis marcescibilis]